MYDLGMHVYFVRHGESALNAQRIHQNHLVPLSKLGRTHASSFGERLKKISFDRLIASPFVRTQQTAETISSAIAVPIEYSDFFVEVKRPTEIEGKYTDDPDVVAIKRTIESQYHDHAYRFSDEETFMDFSSRCKLALAHLEGMTDENILVVTHGDFLKMFLAVTLFGDQLEPQMFLMLKSMVEVSHTGITHFRREHAKWRLISWNSEQ